MPPSTQYTSPAPPVHATLHNLGILIHHLLSGEGLLQYSCSPIGHQSLSEIKTDETTEWNGPRVAMSRFGSAASKEMGLP